MLIMWKQSLVYVFLASAALCYAQDDARALLTAFPSMQISFVPYGGGYFI